MEAIFVKLRKWFIFIAINFFLFIFLAKQISVNKKSDLIVSQKILENPKSSEINYNNKIVSKKENFDTYIIYKPSAFGETRRYKFPKNKTKEFYLKKPSEIPSL